MEGAPVSEDASNPNNHNSQENFVRASFERFLETSDAVPDRSRSSYEKLYVCCRYTDQGMLEYPERVEHMKNTWYSTLNVDYGHLLDYDPAMATEITSEYYRYEPFLRLAVMNFIKKANPPFYHATTAGNLTENGARQFWLCIYGLPQVEKLRELRTAVVGKLLTISGTVTRTSEVRPELLDGHFLCQACGTTIENIPQQFKYTEPQLCSNPQCGNRTKWELQMDKSIFVDFQKVRVQENSDEIPAGSMPRSMDIILRHEAVEKCKAGDKCVFTGMLTVMPEIAPPSMYGDRAEAMGTSDANTARDGVTGLKALGVRDLHYRMCFMASNVRQVDSTFDWQSPQESGESESPETVLQQFAAEERQQLISMKNHPKIYELSYKSIAPSVFGHEEIKRGILLMLFGGVHKKTQDNIELRGDLNVCIVGDPSTAKSQFLKWVTNFLPRAIYTSGRASTAAGLTAAVVKDSETGEFCIEAGALMLADNGVCCIDEFDKMDITDQVAIHEAMEQQTISIAKAGIQATLNARASVLAAANPVFGRYDTSKTLRSNVDISAPIMSRFDLFFICVDECIEGTDRCIAEQICSLHRAIVTPSASIYSIDQLRRYIKYAKQFKPEVKPDGEAYKLLIKFYRKLRETDMSGLGKSAYRITVRQLESMIRLSEALAKLHCDSEVQPKYVKEAFRLLKQTHISVDSEDISFDSDDESGGCANTVDTSASGRAGDKARQDTFDDGLSRQQSVVNTGGFTHTDNTAIHAATQANDEHAAAAPTLTRHRMKLTHSKYNKITHLIKHRLRESCTRQHGMRQQDLVNWYLDYQQQHGCLGEDWRLEGELRNSAESILKMERTMVTLVIRRLYSRDRVLLCVREPNSANGESQGDRLLVVHPQHE